MEPEQLLAFLAGEIVRRKPRTRPLKVGIDGRCASGKTILAAALATELGLKGLSVLSPSVDGFHHPPEFRYRKGEYSAPGYYEDAYDYQAVIDCLLRPLSGDAFPVLCRQACRDLRSSAQHPAWDAGRSQVLLAQPRRVAFCAKFLQSLPDPAPPVSVGADSILLFEGLFLFRRELNPYWDFRILLNIDPATSLSRALDRDSGVIDSVDVIRRKYEQRYEPAWQIYVSREHPESKADVIVDHRDFLCPRILKPVAAGSPRSTPLA